MRSTFAAAVIGVCALAAALTVPARAATPSQPSATVRAEKVAFYACVSAKLDDAAVRVGMVYHQHVPQDDAFTLDLAYAAVGAKRRAYALALLRKLEHSRLAAVRSAAQRQLFAMTPHPGPPQVAASPSPFADAYEEYAGGDLIASRNAFRAGLVKDPDNAAAWHQLAYIELALHDSPAYIVALKRYVALVPGDDKSRLTLAYAEFAANDYPGGRKLIVELMKSPDPGVAEAAKRQYAQLPGNGGINHFSVFGYAVNDSRFHDTFYGFDAMYRLAPWRIYPYVALHYSNDIKASSVPASYILNDNALILAAGFRTQLTPILYAFAEVGEASSLLNGHEQSDLRFGLLLSTRLGTGGRKPQTEIDASLVHYSRYLDTISYGTVAHDFYIGNRIVRGVVGIDTALDTNRAYYSNTIDGFAGLQVRRGGATFRVTGEGGEYLIRGIDVPANNTYTSVRAEVLFGYAR